MRESVQPSGTLSDMVLDKLPPDLRERIRAQVATFPPLTAEQKAAIASLFDRPWDEHSGSAGRRLTRASRPVARLAAPEIPRRPTRGAR